MNELNYSKRELSHIGITCFQFNIKSTARKITAFYDEALKPIGLKSTQFSVLITIAIEESKSITEISNLLEADRTTLQRSLEILGKEGLINIQTGKKGNVRNVSLTSKGIKKLGMAIELWNIAQKNFIEKLGQENSKSLVKLLSKVRGSNLK